MSATIQQLQEKYRHLRKRLTDNFVVIGPGPGMSLPYKIHCNSLYWSIPSGSRKVCDDFYLNAAYLCDQQNGGYAKDAASPAIPAFNAMVGCTNGFVIEFGDTTAELGFYMSLLATEYGLLEMQNNTNAVYRNKLLDEIYYALNALMRLDKRAHQVFGYTSNGCSGYFLRDDAPANFYTNAPKTGPQGTGLLNSDLGAVNGDYIKPSHNGKWNDYVNSFGVFASQDQIIYILMGLSLLNKYLPAGIKSNLSATPLKDITQSISRGIVSKLRDNAWIVASPNGTPNRDAGNMRDSGYAFPVIKIGEKIFQQTYGAANEIFILSEAWWKIGYLFSDISPNNVKMVRMLISLSNVLSLDENFAHCVREDSLRDPYPIIQSLFFNESFKPADQNQLYNHLGNILSSCPLNPAQAGLGSLPAGAQSIPGWRTANRWLHNGVSELNNDSTYRAPTMFNGIDYMLAYNLYHLTFFQDTKYEPYISTSAPAITPLFSRVYESQYATSNVKDAVYYSDQRNEVYYRGTDNKMYIYYQDQNEWKVKALNAQVSNVGDQVMYDLARNKIYYRGTDNRMYNFYVDSNGWHHGCISWNVTNITQDVVYDYNTGKIYYRGTDNRMYTFHWNNNTWNHGSLMWEVSNVAGNIVILDAKVFYRGTDNRMYQFAIVNNKWTHANTRYEANNIKDNLIYVKGIHNKFFYRGTDNKIYTIYWSGGWNSGVLHATTNNAGVKIMHDETTGKLFYISNGNTLHTMYWDLNQWKAGNLDNKQNGIRPDFLISKNSSRIYYTGSDNKLYYFYWTGSQWKSICVNHLRNNVAGSICTNSSETKIFYKSTQNKICYVY